MSGKQHGIMERPLDLQSHRSGFSYTFWPPFSLLKSGTHKCRLHREVAVITSVGPMPRPAPGLSWGWVSPYRPSPSVHLDCASPWGLNQAGKMLEEGGLAVPMFRRHSLVPDGGNWLYLHQVINLFSDHTPGTGNWEASAPAAAGSS